MLSVLLNRPMKRLSCIIVLICSMQIAFSQSGSTPSTIFSQTITLPENWSIFSTYILPLQPDIANILDPILPNIDIVKDWNGQSYWPQYGVNLIGDIVPGNGYQIKLSVADTLTIEGSIIQPDTCPILLPENWSILGYLRTIPAPIDQMLLPIVGKLAIAKNQDGQSYWPQYGVNLIGNMQPGQGYQIKLTLPDTLTFPPNLNNNDPAFYCGYQISDYDGNIYNTVLIGTQCWMVENIKTTHYPSLHFPVCNILISNA